MAICCVWFIDCCYRTQWFPVWFFIYSGPLFCCVFCYLVLRGVACGSRCSSLDRWCADVRSSKAVRRPRPRRERRVLEPRQKREKHTIHIKQQVEHGTKLFWSPWKQKFATAGERLVSLSVAQLVEKEEERAATAAAAVSTWAATTLKLNYKTTPTPPPPPWWRDTFLIRNSTLVHN